MKQRVLLIINPNSGTKRANKFLTEIISIFNREDWECLAYTTQKQGDGRRLVQEYAEECDKVVCIGGDGTLNEIVSGVIASGKPLPIGYIPAGSTNDFANGLGISKNILTAAKNIAKGKVQVFDTGLFGERHFIYVASFGAFAKTSYSTPQNIKNALGYLAYILEGIKDISDIRPLHLCIEANGEVYEDDYIFGAVSNSTSLGGVLTLDPETVDVNDGLLEVLLVRYPKNPIETNECIRALQTRNYDTRMVRFFSTKEAVFHADPKMTWTLDGEFEGGHETVVVKNMPNSFRMIL